MLLRDSLGVSARRSQTSLYRQLLGVKITPYSTLFMTDNNKSGSERDDTQVGTPTRDIDIQQSYTTAELATILLPAEYFETDPPLPYAAWRDNVGQHRTDVTIQIQQSKLNEMERQAQNAIQEELGTKVAITDIRALALFYGLSNIDDIIQMAEIWGLQYY